MPRTDKKKSRWTVNEAGWRAAAAVAATAAVFCLVVATLLIANYLQITAFAPLDNPELLKLRAEMAASPTADPKLVAEIRAMDLLARKAYFTSQEHLRTGAFLLLGGVVVLVAAWRLAARFKPKPPVPDAETPTASHWTDRAHARELLAFTGALFVLAALVSAKLTRLDIPPAPAAEQTAEQGAAPAAEGEKSPAPAAPSAPTWEEMQTQWPAFRGPGGYGVAHFTTAPVDWDGASGKNIKWKSAVPLHSANSPVVWGNRIYLSGATEEKREIYCYDTETGQLLWTHAVTGVPGSPAEPPKISEETGYAAPTMAVQGSLAFAIFANGDLVCVDEAGQMKWGKNLGLPENHYGHSSSLLAFQNLLFVQYDQKKDGKLLALDINSGNEVWKAARGKISWSSPVCVQTETGFQLVLNSSKDVNAYDPLTGKSLWNLECLDGEVAPSPAYAEGMFFVANEYATATAIRLTPGQNPPVAEIAWQWDEYLPDVSSPVLTGTHVFMTTSRGEIICLDRNTGESVWMQELREGFYSSPVLAGDRVYAVDMKGVTFIFKASGTWEQIGVPALGEEVFATPAVMDGRIYFRTHDNLVCVAAG